MKLFMFYIGGNFANSNIELHDMRFAVGRDYGDCFDALRAQWWGDPKTLHIDGWMDISHADGHDITLSRQPSEGSGKLFFLNMGGYEKDVFEETHKNMLLIGNTLAEVQRKALNEARRDFKSPHRDSAMEVETAMCLDDVTAPTGWHIHLTPTALNKAPVFTSRYQKL